MPLFAASSDHPRLKDKFMTLPLTSKPFDRKDKDVVRYMKGFALSTHVLNYRDTPTHVNIVWYENNKEMRMNNPYQYVPLDLDQDMVVEKRSVAEVKERMLEERPRFAYLFHHPDKINMSTYVSRLSTHANLNASAREAIALFEKEFGAYRFKDMGFIEHLYKKNEEDRLTYLQKLIRNMDLFIELTDPSYKPVPLGAKKEKGKSPNPADAVCVKGMVLNPKTGKLIKANGKVAAQLRKDGLI